MTTPVDLTFSIDCINFNDVGNFQTAGDFPDPNISIVISGNNIINRPILSEKIELIDTTNYIKKYNTESYFAKLKREIDLTLNDITNFKDIVEKVFTQLGLTADFTNYTDTTVYAGAKIIDDFVDFEQSNALDIVLNCCAVDGKVLLIDEDDTFYFENIDKIASTVPSIAELDYEIIKNKVVPGFVIYSCDSATSETSKLTEKGDGSFKIINRYFGDNSEISAEKIATNAFNMLSEPIEKITFRSVTNCAPGYVFNFNIPAVNVNADFMILSKTTILTAGALEYRYTAVKKSQAIQLFLFENIFDKILAKNNLKENVNIDIAADLEEDDEFIELTGLKLIYVGTVPKVELYFNKPVASTFENTKYKLWW